MKQIIFSLFVIGMIATTACQQEYIVPEVHIHLDSCKIVVNGDSITINNNTVVEGDSIVNENHLHGGDNTVNGGDLNNTTNTNVINNGNGGGISNGEAITLPDGYSLWKIPVTEFEENIVYDVALHEDNEHLAEFFLRDPKAGQISISFFDGGNNPTTLSFPFKCQKHKNYTTYHQYPFVATDGKFGSDKDKERNIFCLNLYNSCAEIVPVGNFTDGIEWALMDGNSYICGISANDGNNPDVSTGRVLLGTNGTHIFLLRAASATIQEAAEVFEKLKLPFPSMAVAGGSNAQGGKPGAIYIQTKDAFNVNAQ